MEGTPHVDAASGERIAPATNRRAVRRRGGDSQRSKLRLDVNLVGGSGDLVVFKQRYAP